MKPKSLFITGASSGIGAATARLAVSQGWRVGLFARSAGKLDALVDELGGKAVALPGDVTDLANLKAAMATFVDQTGGLDAAFANAGMGLSAAGTDAGDPVEWQQMIGVNILGVLCDKMVRTRIWRQSVRRNEVFRGPVHGHSTRHGRHAVL